MHGWVAPATGPDDTDVPFLDAFNPSFLIRDPAKTLTSMYAQWPDFTLSETGFAEQRALFDLLTQRSGTPPPVIDADDLLDDPHRVTAAWCEAVGIDFKPAALEWGTSSASDHTWYESGTWHANLAQSTTLSRQKRDYVSIDHNQLLLDAHEACLPHYRAMHSHRLTG